MELIHKHINLYLNCKLYTYKFDNTEPTELCNIVTKVIKDNDTS